MELDFKKFVAEKENNLSDKELAEIVAKIAYIRTLLDKAQELGLNISNGKEVLSNLNDKIEKDKEINYNNIKKCKDKFKEFISDIANEYHYTFEKMEKIIDLILENDDIIFCNDSDFYRNLACCIEKYIKIFN